MPQDPNSMYRWRQWTAAQRTAILLERKHRHHPCHSPSHRESDHSSYYMITAACFEHQSVIAESSQRISDFSTSLCSALSQTCQAIYAWVVLPNHYHSLVSTLDLANALRMLGQLHGRTSFYWNDEDRKRGRQVWCNAAETAMKSERHFYASINFILNNPVHHGYCDKWSEWPFSNADEYLSEVGREAALSRWREYPVFEYGQSWDPPSL